MGSLITSSQVNLTIPRHLSRRDELELYLKALDETEGDLSMAARRLGIKRTTLYMRIKRMQHNLDRDVIT